MQEHQQPEGQIHRRDVLKTAIGTLVASTAVAGAAVAQQAPGPFDLPSTTFDPKRLDIIHPWAFKTKLPIPLVPRPTFVGTYDELMKTGIKPFGPGDDTPICESFHGIAREWYETPDHWKMFGLDPHLKGVAAWNDKIKNFGQFYSYDDTDGKKPKISNWGGFPIKCYKIPIVEFQKSLAHNPMNARMYGYAGMSPGPSYAFRLGQPVVVRYENQLDTEVSIHLHGGHSPSHSDGFPTFFTLQGKARDYFYPNILPLKYVKSQKNEPPIGGPNHGADCLNPGSVSAVDDPAIHPPLVTQAGYAVDQGEGQSTMWYHDHGMDATGYNVSKGLAGVAKCFGERELKLIRDGVLPGLREKSCIDPEMTSLLKGAAAAKVEDPDHPGFYQFGEEPYHNPYDIYMVIQDKVIDPETGQIAYDSAGHNGYLGDSVLVNGEAYPRFDAEFRKYRFRFLNGSNSRIYRLRLLSENDYTRMRDQGVGPIAAAVDAQAVFQERAGRYNEVSQPFMRIGKDSWLWSKPLLRTSVTIAMANRADIIVDFGLLAQDLKEGEETAFYLVNTMPQFDGRGPSAALADGGDPRVLPLPFDTVATDGGIQATTVAELHRPMPLMKFVVKREDGKLKLNPDATINLNTTLNPHEPIRDDEVQVVREFTFQRGNGAWMVNKRFYDPTIANATPTVGSVEEWVLRNGGGGWWHPIHIHLESHQLVSYEKDFLADQVVDPADPPAQPALQNLISVLNQMDCTEVSGLHDTQILGPNTVARIRMRFRTWSGPFVFHCHNLEHEDMRMMHNFEPVPRGWLIDPITGDIEEGMRRDANTAPDARTHGDDVTYQPPGKKCIGELPWEEYPVPRTPTSDAGDSQIPQRGKK